VGRRRSTSVAGTVSVPVAGLAVFDFDAETGAPSYELFRAVMAGPLT
jgi:hypothetical protein